MHRAVDDELSAEQSKPRRSAPRSRPISAPWRAVAAGAHRAERGPGQGQPQRAKRPAAELLPGQPEPPPVDAALHRMLEEEAGTCTNAVFTRRDRRHRMRIRWAERQIDEIRDLLSRPAPSAKSKTGGAKPKAKR